MIIFSYLNLSVHFYVSLQFQDGGHNLKPVFMNSLLFAMLILTKVLVLSRVCTGAIPKKTQ